MRFQALFFLLLLACMYLSLAQGSYGNCCLKYSKGTGRLKPLMIKEYRMQETDGDCNINAIVVVLKRNSKTICVNPADTRIKLMIQKMENVMVKV